MKTWTNKRYGAVQLLLVVAVFVVMIGVITLHSSTLWPVFLFVAVAMLRWWADQWFPASAKSFVVSKKDDVVACVILGPCMVWMRGAMKGNKVINCNGGDFIASIRVITGTPLHGGNLVVTTMSVTATIGCNTIMLQDYWRCFKEMRLSEVSYMEKRLRAFQGSEYELFFGQVQRSGRVGTSAWVVEDLLPRLQAYLLRELGCVGLTVVDIEVKSDVVKCLVYGKKEKEE